MTDGSRNVRKPIHPEDFLDTFLETISDKERRVELNRALRNENFDALSNAELRSAEKIFQNCRDDSLVSRRSFLKKGAAFVGGLAGATVVGNGRETEDEGQQIAGGFFYVGSNIQLAKASAESNEALQFYYYIQDRMQQASQLQRI